MPGKSGISGNFVLGRREEEEGRCILKCVCYAYTQGHQAKDCRTHCSVFVEMESLQLVMPLEN